MKGALDVHRELLARDVPHEMVRLSGRVSTADDLPLLLGVRGGCIAVRIYAVAREHRRSFAAVLVPSGLVPEPLALLQALGACTVSAAGPDTVNEVTDYVAGLVGPFCLPPAVELLADAAVGRHDVSYCPVGEPQLVLGIRTRDLLVSTAARVAALTAPALEDDLLQVIDLDRRTGARSRA